MFGSATTSHPCGVTGEGKPRVDEAIQLSQGTDEGGS